MGGLRLVMRSIGGSETTMRVALFGRLFHTSGPTAEKQRPEGHRAGNDEQPKSPTPVRRVRVNLLHANQSEWDGEHQPASQVSCKQDQEYRCNHGVLVPPSPIRWERVGVRACFSDFNSALSE